MNAASSIPRLAVSERISAVIYALCQTLAMRARVARLTDAQLSYIVQRLLGIRKRFRRLAECIRVGRPPRERARKPRVTRARPETALAGGFAPPPGWRRWARPLDQPVPMWRALGQKFGWLLPLAPSLSDFRENAVVHRTQLLALLAEPETRALFSTSRYVGDSLRPLCWMLGIDASLLYPARPAALSASTPTAAATNPVSDDNEMPVAATPAPSMIAVTELPDAEPRGGTSGNFFVAG